MKTIILLLLFAFFGLNNLTAQNYSEVYNSVYERYDFINSSGNLIGYRIWNEIYKRWDYKDSNGNLNGYQTYNTVYERWDYTDLRSQNNQNNQSEQAGRYIVHDYGEVKSNFNTNLALQALAYKQAQYDRLSPEQKQQIAQQANSNKSREWVIQNLMVWKPKFERKQKRQNKEISKETKTLKKAEKRAEKENINTLEDGVYEIVYTDYNTYLEEEVYSKRYILIQSNKPILYTSGDNLIFNVSDFKILENNLYSVKLSNQYNKSQSNLFFYIPNQKPLEKFPELYKASKYTMYAKEDLGGDIFVDIYNIETNKTYIGIIDKYYSNKISTCDDKKLDGVASFLLPPGKYKYFAYTKTKVWANDFEIIEGGCSALVLTSS